MSNEQLPAEVMTTDELTILSLHHEILGVYFGDMADTMAASRTKWAKNLASKFRLIGSQHTKTSRIFRQIAERQDARRQNKRGEIDVELFQMVRDSVSAAGAAAGDGDGGAGSNA